MGHLFGTQEWASALQREINESSEYRNAARGWGVAFNGDMLFRFEPDGMIDVPLHLLIKLKDGKCQGAKFVDDAAKADAGFRLSAPLGLWQDIMCRRTLAATAILTGKLQVEGDKMTLLKNTAANRALIHCTASVDTEWK